MRAHSINTKPRIVGLASALLVAFFLLSVGTWLETYIFDGLTSILKNKSFLSVILFFSVVNLNALLAFVLIFLSFRNAVKLVVERQGAVFGSSLQTRLVTLFLFFSLVPTLILLYISTKFVNARFENWMPPSLTETAIQSSKSEHEYREKISKLLTLKQQSAAGIETYDFIASVKDLKKIEMSDPVASLKNEILNALAKGKNNFNDGAQWFQLNNDRLAVAVRFEGKIFGIVSPPSIHNRWTLLSGELSEAQPGVELVRLSYYILLGALTVLLIFSALWLGVTIARELTGPLQTLAQATNSVAQGEYEVNIDDVVSDDELGQLARSFRSMVGDLRDARGRALQSASELEHKAALLSEKTEYYASVLREVQAAVIALDENLNLESCNPACERLFSIEDQKARGQNLSNILPVEFYQHWLHPMLLPLIESALVRVEGEFSGRLGISNFQLVVTAIALTKPDGRRAYLLIAEDVTHIARAQRSAAWREVARKVAHEIKNPLTPIKLGAQRLERRLLAHMDGEDREVMRESLSVIVQSADTIKRLVDEFVSVARMPGARMQESNILESLRLAAASFSENPEHIRVEIEVWKNAEGKYVTLPSIQNQNDFIYKYDPEQIGRALINLLSNAISASVGIKDAHRVVIRLGSPNCRSNQLEISIVDWGQGVPDAVRERIFEPYFSTKRTGTGLGLVIVQQIVHEHGGQLRVSQNSPRGTVFTMSLFT